MPDQTPILALPVLVPNQAQPYVTHNEALRRLDILVQTRVTEFGAETPPALPEEGDLYALGAAPVAEWAGQAGRLAARIDGAWLFVAPQPGWRAWDQAAGVLRVWDGAGWVRPPADLDNVAGVGIGTASDPVNRLAVTSDAVLFSHDGAGHQLKINKAADSDTASLLFQSGWAGHAEIGLAGDTDLVLKVSADGSAWTEALRFDATSGEAFGAALQSGPADTSAGRIPKMGNDADFDALTVHSLAVDSDTLCVDTAHNRVGIGTASPTDSLHVTGILRVQKPTANNSLPTIGSPTAAYFDHINTASSKNCAISVLATNDGASSLNFGDQDDEDPGRINYSHAGDVMSFYTAGAKVMEIDDSGNVGIGVSPPAYKLHVEDALNVGAASRIDNSHASFSNANLLLTADRAANSAYNYLRAYSGNIGDLEFQLSGDGNGTCDGSWTGGGADYAEYFEWFDGNQGAEDRRGVSVVLDGDKIRPAQPGEEPIGVISANPSVVGDGDIDRWKGKYLRDDFGAYIWEDYEVVEWVVTVTEEDGDDATAREVVHSHAADAVPEGVTVPDDATRTTQQRRRLNPAYDPDVPYTPRAERPEWDTVGLMGKLRLRKGQPVGARWIRMRDVSEDVEEWLVR